MKFSNGYTMASRLLRARVQESVVRLATPLWPRRNSWLKHLVPPTDPPIPTGPKSVEEAKDLIANVLAPSIVGLKSIKVPVHVRPTCSMGVDLFHRAQPPILHPAYPLFTLPVRTCLILDKACVFRPQLSAIM